jgi:hypothetical protein
MRVMNSNKGHVMNLKKVVGKNVETNLSYLAVLLSSGISFQLF